jgi:hypothetical protein
MWKGRLLHYNGHLALIKTTLSVIPIYSTISLIFPAWLLKAMDRIWKGFLWCGIRDVQSEKCLVAWSRVQQPLHLGGLGVLDPKIMGRGLRLHGFGFTARTKPTLGRASPDLVTTAFFQTSIRCVVGDGSTIYFWTNPWIERQCISLLCSRLGGCSARSGQTSTKGGIGHARKCMNPGCHWSTHSSDHYALPRLMAKAGKHLPCGWCPGPDPVTLDLIKVLHHEINIPSTALQPNISPRS